MNEETKTIMIVKSQMPLEAMLATAIKEVPIWEKHILTIDEACKYFNIGDKKLRQLVDDNADNPHLVLMNGVKRLIKRENFAKYLEETRSI